MPDGVDLNQTDDAMLWAKTFVEIFGNRRDEIDLELMFGWFANAMETGRTFGLKEGERLSVKI